MRYISTRGETAHKPFSEVLLMGLAPDGGLMLPEHYPQIGRETLDKWRGLAYPELAFEIMCLFVTDIPEDDLRDILNRTYTEAAFGTKEIAPSARFQTASKSKPCPTARRWRSKIWRCSFWAMRLNMF